MSSELILTNARVVTRNGDFFGTVHVVEGRIAAVDRGASALPAALDLDGDILIPGIVDIHTDALEYHLEPRPGVHWPAMAALIAHDRQIAAAGITTVFDALMIGEYEGMAPGRQEALVHGLEVMEQATADDLLKSQHFLHLRCEMSAHDVVDRSRVLIDDPFVRLVSLMDHTPGQRQWSDLQHWRQFYSRMNYTEEKLQEILARRRRIHEEEAPTSRRQLVDLCQERDLPLASHDDTLPEHVLEAVSDRIAISEFPTSEEAARLAHEHGMRTVMGGPNVVNGGSHSGNVAAGTLADAGLLDGLASDYVPMSMIQAAFILHRNHAMALHEAIATVTANPADMVGLDDRGQIASGRRADLVRIKPYAVPVVATVWREGRMVA